MNTEPASSRLRKLVHILFAWAIVVDAGACVYHFNSGGIPSGTTQLVLAIVLALSWYLVYFSSRRVSAKKYALFRFTGLSLIAIAAIVLFCFGIYHFGTPTGLRSGLTETLLAVYPIRLDVLLYKAYPPTGTDTP